MLGAFGLTFIFGLANLYLAFATAVGRVFTDRITRALVVNLALANSILMLLCHSCL